MTVPLIFIFSNHISKYEKDPSKAVINPWRQPHTMFKHTQIIRRQQRISNFDFFEENNHYWSDLDAVKYVSVFIKMW